MSDDVKALPLFARIDKEAKAMRRKVRRAKAQQARRRERKRNTTSTA
jgi:hypothetical protein